jgi:peroxiredoxin
MQIWKYMQDVSINARFFFFISFVTITIRSSEKSVKHKKCVLFFSAASVGNIFCSVKYLPRYLRVTMEMSKKHVRL